MILKRFSYSVAINSEMVCNYDGTKINCWN